MPATYSLIAYLLNLYVFLIIVWVILGWLQAMKVIPYSKGLHSVMTLLYRLTNPLLEPIRRVLPPMGGFDLSPLVLIIIIEIFRAILRDIMF